MNRNNHNDADRPEAYRLADLVERGPFGRSKLYEEIAAGRLIARKAGRATVVLADDWTAFLHSLPPVRAGRAA